MNSVVLACPQCHNEVELFVPIVVYRGKPEGLCLKCHKRLVVKEDAHGVQS